MNIKVALLSSTFGLLLGGLTALGTPPNPGAAAEAYDRAATPGERAKVLRGIIDQANDLERRGLEGHSELRMVAASRLAAEGRGEEAVALWEAVRAKPEASTVFRSAPSDVYLAATVAWANFESARGSPIALDLSREAVEVWRGLPGEERTCSVWRSFASAAEMVATDADVRGGREGIELRAQVMDGPEGCVPPETYAALANSNALREFRLGRRAEGVAWIDRVFTKYPDFEGRDGQGVYLRLTRILAGRSPRELRGEDVDALRALWDHPSAERAATSMNVAMALNVALSVSPADRRERVERAAEAVKRWEVLPEDVKRNDFPGSRGLTSGEEAYREMLVQVAMGGRSQGMAAEAYEAASKLLQLEPEHGMKDPIRRELNAALEEIASRQPGR